MESPHSWTNLIGCYKISLTDWLFPTSCTWPKHALVEVQCPKKNISCNPCCKKDGKFLSAMVGNNLTYWDAILLKLKTMWCFVSLPDSVITEFKLSDKARGQLLLDQVWLKALEFFLNSRFDKSRFVFAYWMFCLLGLPEVRDYRGRLFWTAVCGCQRRNFMAKQQKSYRPTSNRQPTIPIELSCQIFCAASFAVTGFIEVRLYSKR